MKNTILCLFTIILLPGIIHAQKVSLEKIWETSVDIKVPESVRYCKSMDKLFVSNIGTTPDATDGAGFISILNPDGSAHNLKWVTGLNAPKGMDIMDGKLYVTEVDRICVIDIKTAKVENRIPVKGATFLNDVTADPRTKSVYFSDSHAGKAIVYQLKSGEVTEFYSNKEIPVTNGLHIRGDLLYMGADQFYSINLKTKKLTLLVKNTDQIDGLESITESLFIGTNWPGKIFSLNTNGELTELVNEIDYNTADIGINQEQNTIYVPTFFRNTIIAYKYIID